MKKSAIISFVSMGLALGACGGDVVKTDTTDASGISVGETGNGSADTAENADSNNTTAGDGDGDSGDGDGDSGDGDGDSGDGDGDGGTGNTTTNEKWDTLS